MFSIVFLFHGHRTWTEIHHPFLDVATVGGRSPFRAAAAPATSWRRAPRAARRCAGGGGSASLEAPWGWHGEDGYEWDINKGISIGKSIILLVVWNDHFYGLIRIMMGYQYGIFYWMWIEAIIKHTYGSLNRSFTIWASEKIADDQSRPWTYLGSWNLCENLHHRPPTYRYHQIPCTVLWYLIILNPFGERNIHWITSHKWM